MEPLNCTVSISKDKCEIWTGTQFQTLDQMVAGQITGLKPEQVEIHTEFLGGGFGRRANPTSDFVSRGGACRQGRRYAGENRVGAGGRHPWRLLPFGVPAPCAYRAGRWRPAAWPGSM